MKENEIILAVRENAKIVKQCTLKQYHKIATGPESCAYSFWITDKAEFNKRLKEAKSTPYVQQWAGYSVFNQLHNERKTRRYS